MVNVLTLSAYLIWKIPSFCGSPEFLEGGGGQERAPGKYIHTPKYWNIEKCIVFGKEKSQIGSMYVSPS